MQTNLIVVGSGGTGTYFLKEVSRYLASKDRKKLKNYYIVDGDVVEKKNLSRQAFADEDIGRNKAEVMTEVLNEAFSLNWKAVEDYILKKEQLTALTPHKGDMTVIIGCVDNHGCRLVLEDYFNSSENCIYIDAANEFHSGETVFAARVGGVTFAPPRSYYFPDILKKDVRNRDAISCEELNNSAPQHILANMCSALNVLSAFIKFFEEDEVTCGYSVYDPFKNFCRFYKAEDCKWVLPQKRGVS